MQCMYQNLIKKKIDVDIKETSVRSNLRVRMLIISVKNNNSSRKKKKKEP